MKKWPNFNINDWVDCEKKPEKLSPTSDKNRKEKQNLNVSSFLNKYKTNKEVWKDSFRVLKEENRDKGTFENIIRFFENNEHTKILSSFANFDYLLTASDEELEKAYLEYFEPQTSKFYLGGVLVALESDAFKKWFFCEKNNIPDEIDENTKQMLDIVDRILEIKNKKETEQNLEKLHKDLSK